MDNKVKKLVSLSVITACVFTSPLGMVANAEKKGDDYGKVKIERTIKEVYEKEKDKKEEKEKKEKAWKLVKEEIKIKRKAIDKENKELKAQIKELEKQLEAAKKMGKVDLYEELSSKIDGIMTDFDELKAEIKKIKLEMKEMIKNSYTEEELKDLMEKAKKMEKEDKQMKAIPVENIITKKMNLKFDTPPVIKAGRTLIPVRAITEGFGAAVAWNPENREVLISKGDVEMLFQLDNGKVFVNGEETAIDVPAQLMNNRTIVPLRFIVEQLGLHVDYDGETGIIEIDEEADLEDEVVIEDVEQDVIVPVEEDEVVPAEEETEEVVISETESTVTIESDEIDAVSGASQGQ